MNILRLSVDIPPDRRRGSVRISALCIIVEHVGKNILGIFKPLGHLSIVRLECLVQWQGLALTFLVNIGY